jgi:spiro-SPASM protein
MTNNILIYVDDAIVNDDQLLSINENPEIIPVQLKQTFLKTIENSEIYFSVPDNYTGQLLSEKTTLIRTGSMQTDWKNLFNTSNSDNIIRIQSDAPFTDPEIVLEMLEIHIKYLAEFTYSENIPSGYCCDIISSILINSLPEETEDKVALPLEKVIRDNINQFDVELFYKEPDIRFKRLQFRTVDKREAFILKNIYNINSRIPSYSEIQTTINNNPEVLYIGPSYIEIQLTTRRETKPVYLYQNSDLVKVDISIDTIKKIVSDMKTFNLHYHVALVYGDPLLHKDFFAILEILLNETLIQTIIIETEASSSEPNFISFLEEKNDPRIKVIIECNGYSSETYKNIHGIDIFDIVHENIVKINDILKNNLYIQIMKINETETYLDEYYNFWEQKKVQIILQKQNTYIGKVEDRRYYDLTPLKRFSCWHLQRDLYILPDGTVSFCKQDIEGNFFSLNVNDMPIAKIWETRKPLFLDDYNGKFSKSPDCAKCDEWFTFNL